MSLLYILLIATTVGNPRQYSYIVMSLAHNVTMHP